jgi:hypothetical protein
VARVAWRLVRCHGASSTFETLMTRRDLTITLLRAAIDSRRYPVFGIRFPLDSCYKPRSCHQWREYLKSVNAFVGHNMSNGHVVQRSFELFDPYLMVRGMRWLTHFLSCLLLSEIRSVSRFQASRPLEIERGLACPVAHNTWGFAFQPTNLYAIESALPFLIRADAWYTKMMISRGKIGYADGSYPGRLRPQAIQPDTRS